MFDWFKAKSNKLSEEEVDALEEKWYDKKSEIMEAILGPEHDMVMHAVIPYEVGGGLDLYYYPNGISGTGIATKELSFACRESSTNDEYASYELVMYTPEAIDLDNAYEDNHPFGIAHQHINAVLNAVAHYSAEACLNPRETLEFPADFEDIGGRCFILDAYTGTGRDVPKDEEGFGVMLLIEVFRAEMERAREAGGKSLLEKLKAAGVYPYSNLAREAVV